MATPTPVDQTVQRDRNLLPDQADPPGSPKVLAGEAPPSGPDTPEVTAEFSDLSPSLPLLSSSSSTSSSPLASSAGDSPPEASSPWPSDYDSEPSEEDDHDDEMDAPDSAIKERHSPFPLSRRPDRCLGAGWAPGDTLPNRSFANEHIAVAKSTLQGHGVFAAVSIREGTEVLVEAPLLSARGWGKLGAKHALLGDEEKAVYDGLVGHHEWDECPVRQKWSANAFDLARGYSGVFAISSNFNHACRSRRNTKYEWDERHQVMTFTATRDIEEGAELLVSYCEYRHVLKAVYGFVCHCGGCEHQEVDLFNNRRS